MDRESRGEQTRRELLDAAIQRLAAAGVAGTTFVDVAKRCGLSRGAIHHHFPQMDDLLLAVVEQIGEIIRQRAFEILDQVEQRDRAYAKGIDAVWTQMQTVEYRALVQLRNGLVSGPTPGVSVRQAVLALNHAWMRAAERLPGRFKHKADQQLIRVVLTALAGAMTLDTALGAPADDPERTAFREKLKTIVLSSRPEE